MNGLHFSIDLPVEEQPQTAGGLAAGAPAPAVERRLAHGYVDLPGAPGRRVEVEVVRGEGGTEMLEVSVRAHDEPSCTTYVIPLAWLMRRLALAHLAYRPDSVRGIDPTPRAD
jgi:hypothetical protein